LLFFAKKREKIGWILPELPEIQRLELIYTLVMQRGILLHIYSTLTDFARFRGLSISQPRINAT